MLTHFTTKAYLVYAKYWGSFKVSAQAIGVFNTEKRAIACKEKYLKEHPTAEVEIIEVEVNPGSFIKLKEICVFSA